MSDHEQLLLVIVVIYLTDCLFWASRCAVVFRDSFLSGTFTISHPSTYLGHDRGGAVFRNPLPPFGTTMICPDRPCSVTSEHGYSYTAASALFGARPAHPERIVALDEVRSVTVDAKDVLVDGKVFAHTDSNPYARRLAEFLDRLARMPRPERAAAIAAHLEASLDLSAIEARVVQFDQATSTLRIFCTSLFLVLFVALPWVVFRNQFGVYWLHLLAVLAACVIAIGVLYMRAHRALYPGDPADRRAGLAMMLLVPPAAVRACDALARNLVVGFDVLAVARVACDDPSFRSFAACVLRDLTHPALPVCPSTGADEVETEARHRSNILRVYVSFLERAGLRIDDLLVPPVPDAGALSYCPRCHEQFTMTVGDCRACGGLALVTFPVASAAGENNPVPWDMADEHR